MQRHLILWLFALRVGLTLPLYAAVPPANSAFLENGVTAHRGGDLGHPENTLHAFREAIALGVDWVELDIYQTRDGALVVCHDSTTGRTADRDMKIADATLGELLTLDMGSSYRREHNLSLEQCPPVAMPLLSEVLELIKTQHRTRVSIQPKMDCVEAAIAMIRQMKAVPWVGFNEGALSRIIRVKELAPEIPVFWDRPEKVDVEKDLRLARELKIGALIYHSKAVTENLIQQCHAAGISVGAWTVNNKDQMGQFLGWKIDRLYTDHPDVLLPLMQKRASPK